MIGTVGCLRRAAFVPPAPPEPIAPVQAASGAAIPDAPLTLESAVRLALARNPDLRAAVARVELARAAWMGSGAAFLPQVAGEVSYLKGDAPSAFLFKRIDARALPPGVDFNAPGEFSNVEAGLGLRWNVWNGGRDVLGRWAAEAVASAGAARDADRNALVGAVTATYLEARAAGGLAAADVASVHAVEAQVEATRVRVSGGAALRADLLSVEVHLAEARERALATRVRERLALAALRDLLALAPDVSIAVAREPFAERTLPATAADALAEAYRRRPETRAARAAVERGQLELAAARRAYLPRVDVGSRLYVDDAAARGDAGDANWTVAVALSIDVFDGGGRAAAIRRARAVLDELGAADRRLLGAVARDVEAVYLRLDEARARRDVATGAVGAAEEALAAVTTQFRGGAVPVTRYLEAEAAAARARAVGVQARLDAERAEAEAARAIGRLGAGVEGGTE
ncbi:MAG: TolC family protein [Candidatus Binatia bacterium]